MKALRGGHKSKEAAQIIDNFMKAHPDYPQNLKNKVLEASWILMKQVPYVEPAKPKATTAKPKTSATQSKAKAKATSKTNKKTTKKR
jgi:aminopeptidase N